MASAESEAAGEEADASGEGDGTAGTFRDTLEPEDGESAGGTEGVVEVLAVEAEPAVLAEAGDGESGSQPDGVAGGRNAPGKAPVRSGS